MYLTAGGVCVSGILYYLCAMTTPTVCFILLILVIILFVSYCVSELVGLYFSDNSRSDSINADMGSWYMRTRDEHIEKGHTERTEYTNYGKMMFPTTTWVDKEGNKVNDWD